MSSKQANSNPYSRRSFYLPRRDCGRSRYEEDMVLVAQAANGREGIIQFRAHRPDVTLMDLQMPVMDGNDAIMAIRSEFPGARIIAMTTYRGDARALRAFEAGASGYLLKGGVRKELVEAIRSVHAGQEKYPPR